MKEFKDKVAVITGAASGIGYGLAERCAKEGMRVILADIEEGTLVKAENHIKALGATTLAVQTDVSKASDVEALSRKTVDTFGAVHLLFNNAGVSAGLNVWESSLADWQWVLGVNLWGVIYGIHYFVPLMIKQNSECHIVNTASDAGLMTPSNVGATYTVSKHGVTALSEVLYKQLEERGHNIGVSVLCPGFTRTNLLESDRNRPDGLQNKPGEGTDISSPDYQAWLTEARKLIDGGMSPQQVADKAFNAIKQNTFYIFTSAESCKPAIQARMENILLERNPTNAPIT